MKALIAAGGRGTRLYPITFTSNKHLIPVANKPLLLYPVEAVAAAGIKEVGVIVNETQPAVEALLGDGSQWGFNITYIFQEKPEGLGHVVKVAEEFLAGSPFLLHNGDNIFTDGITRPLKHFLKTKPDALLTITKHEENWRLGVPFFDDQGKLVKVVEKPKNPPNPYGVPGLYFFNRHVFEAFKGKDRVKKSARGEYEITDLYTYLLEHGYRVEYEEVGGWWRDPGKMEDLLEANSLILDKFNEHRIEGRVDQESKISGDVTIEKGSTVTRSVIRGPVVIGRNVVVEDSYVGPFTSIYHECVIKNCEVENSVLLQGARLENLDKRVDKSLIGNKAQVIRTDTRPRSYNFLIGDMSHVDLF